MRALLNIGLLFLSLKDAIHLQYIPALIPALQLNESCCFSLFTLGGLCIVNPGINAGFQHDTFKRS